MHINPISNHAHPCLRVVEGDHELWQGVSEPYKHVIRAFLVRFHASLLRHSSEYFCFRNGSIGGKRLGCMLL